MDFDIDYVFPYVNNNDTQWLEQYKSQCELRHRKFDANGSRVFDYGTLKYLMRGINYTMPWIRNVYIIVESESQIPNYINQNKVKFIFHRDIMPISILPTYNSGAIEMHLQNIPELAEHFIYGNDDMFPIKSTRPEQFFTNDGLPVLKVRSKTITEQPTMYQRMLCNCEKLIRKECGIDLNDSPSFHTSSHSLLPMLKSTWQYLYTKYEKEILHSCTQFRSSINYTQQLFLDYSYWTKKYNKDCSIKTKYIRIDKEDFVDIFNDALQSVDIICVNDFDTRTKENIEHILKSFNKLFPNISKYEN